MAYRFALDETPQAGLRRIADEQASRIVKRLAADNEGATTIHESRKALKRIRALFKLVRGGLGKQVYAREYGVARDVARSLSGPRDLDVMPVTLASLATTGRRRAAAEQVQVAIERARADAAGIANRSQVLAAAIEDLEAARQRYARLRLAGNSDAVLVQGAAAGLGMLRRQCARAVLSGEDEDYHDWRKSAQLHWRHLRLLSESWPALIEARIAVAQGLADVLGHDHDLTVLAGFIKTIPSSALKAAGRKALLGDIRARQLALRAEARAAARLLTVDRPKRFAARLSAYRAARIEFSELEQPHSAVFAPLPRA